MEQSILKLLKEIEADHSIEILYACESGSRAWAFASPDSDYDIRFIYRRSIASTISTGDLASTIECPIENDLDPAGWDLRKTLGLLRKNNGALIEWIHSPICYSANEEFLNEIRALTLENINQRDLSNHYRGLANQVYQSRIKNVEPSAKSYLYALRAILAAHFVLEQNTPPPVPFFELIPTAPGAIQTAINDLVTWKSIATENASPGNISILDEFISSEISILSESIAQLETTTTPIEPYDATLRNWSLLPSLRKPLINKPDFTLNRVREHDLLLFEAISGSRSFGTEHEKSDFDLRGIFAAPPSFLCGLDSIDQISDAKSDEVYYELGRFMSLLEGNNPNIIELLFTPSKCIRYKHPVIDLLKPEIFLSKLCQQTFGNYAMGQIRKARGLNKKIVNPQPEQRKHLREFCYILEGQGSLDLTHWLNLHNYQENRCGLVAVNHAPNTYAIFHSIDQPYRGMFSPKDDSALICSSVPKHAKPIAWVHCNIDAYKAHCRSHREYWQWVNERDEDRYTTNTQHGHDYDSKNLMHTLRLLDQATEIAREGAIYLPRPNADWLKKVKRGDYSYEDILKIADEKSAEMDDAFAHSSLPAMPDRNLANSLLLETRNELFQTG